jgi:ceramide glucosyltransferase
MSFLIIILLFLLSGGFAYQTFSLFLVWSFFRQQEKSGGSISPPPVSILKPLKGIDPDFKDNISTFCRQDYRDYEVLAGFSEPGDSAIQKVRDMVPFIDSRIQVVVTENNFGPNRKVSNLQGLVDASRYSLLAISDSDMRVDASYLGTIAGEYQSGKKTGLVTCLYKISNPRTMGAAFESLVIALDFIPSVLVARRLEGITFGLGASMLLSKEGLQDIGGLPAIAGYLADDYQIGRRLWRKGYKIILSRVVIENVVGPMSIADHLSHQVRWARTYRASRPKGFAGYGITHIFPFALLLLILQGPTVLALSVLGAVLALRLCLAVVIYKKVIRFKNWLTWLPLLPIKDLLSFGIWAWSFAGNRVIWRGRTFKLMKDGRIAEERKV